MEFRICIFLIQIKVKFILINTQRDTDTCIDIPLQINYIRKRRTIVNYS